MARNLFGWDYPAGAENDPNAPWNQKDPEFEADHKGFCERCGKGDDESPIDLDSGGHCEECAIELYNDVEGD